MKVGKLPPYTQKVSAGFVVVGFSGTRLFCMRVAGVGGGGASTITIDVPPFAALYQMLDLKQFADSYKCACLGVPLPLHFLLFVHIYLVYGCLWLWFNLSCKLLCTVLRVRHAQSTRIQSLNCL